MAIESAQKALDDARIKMKARDETLRAMATAEADQRVQALQTVLDALLASMKPRGFDRKKFQARIALAGRDTPDSGPAAVRHAIYLAEARKVLGIDPNAPA
ncbi:ATP-dependent helicase [Methylobacterium sp. J-070]|uniref:ATP-dependent helicase n=1 Tax=Methylobacterium sp. J-070 TaxID=2836650 RepID=UPI001FB9A10E|nr:ATP-dependent helicase [Methylobacterium sp. J-070]MCJ2054937.1 ATP-dependent helicase [Methylobacterium sp. J-070]